MKNKEENKNNKNNINVIDNQRYKEKEKNNVIINIDDENKNKNKNESNINSDVDFSINEINNENKEKTLNKRFKEIQLYINNLNKIENYYNIGDKNIKNNIFKEYNEKSKNINHIKNNYKNKNTKINNYFINTKKDNRYFFSENVKQNKKRDFLSNGFNENKKSKKIIFKRYLEDNNKRKNTQKEKESKLNKDFISFEKINKKYNKNEWNEIYKKRFKSYQDNIDKKREEKKKFYEEEKKKKEDEIINLFHTKKAPLNHIIEVSQKMYDEAKKRDIRIKQKNIKNKEFDDADEFINNYLKNKCKSYIFDERRDKVNNKNLYDRNNNLNQYLINDGMDEFKFNDEILKNNKRMTVSEFNNRRFSIPNNRYNKDNTNSNKNFINIDANIYNLEEERNILIEMAKHKNLYQVNNDFNDNDLIKKNKRLNSAKKNNLESEKLIYKFFMKQLEL